MRAKGFTLLEVLVALAVLGSVLTTVFGVFSSGLRSLSQSDDRLTLALIAESLLNRADLDLTRAESEVSGSMPDGVRWRVTRRPYAASQATEGLQVEEAPRRPARDEDLLPPEEGEEQAAEGEGRREPGMTRASPYGGDDETPSSDEPARTRRSSFASRAGTEGEQQGSTAASPARLRAWLLTAEVANQRGLSFALSRLSVESARETTRERSNALPR